MKFVPVMALALVLLAGCEPQLTLEQAQALCAQKGGMLTIFYTQEITRTSTGPLVANPGDCILPSAFAVPAAPSANKAPPASP